jgi:cation diffusion facilitator family transporter
MKENLEQKKMRAASFTVYTNVFLIAVKLTASILTGSLALVATFVDSFFDFLSSSITYLGVRKAGTPADIDHLYGHYKYENISSLAQTTLITITALLIINEAVRRFLHPIELHATVVGIAAILATIATDILLSRYLSRKSQEYGSDALEASALNYKTDVWHNSAVLIGLVAVEFGFQMADPVAAVVVALVMAYAALKMGAKAFGVLTDASPSQKVLADIVRVIHSFPEVKSFHKMRARYSGRKIFVEFHLQMEKEMPLEKAHALAHKVKEKIMRVVKDIEEVTIHLEPK